MYKRKIILLLLLFHFFFIYGEENISYYKAIDNNINIRTAPNTKSNILGQLYKDDIIKVDFGNSTNKWLYGFIPKINAYGYCYAEFFDKYQPFFFQIVDELMDENQFYIQMVESGNVLNCVSYDIFNSRFTKLEQYPEEKIMQLLKFGYKNNCFYDSTQSGNVLTECVERNYLSITEYLLTETDSIEKINSTYTSYYGPPIFFAVLHNLPEMLELLLRYGADPNKTARNGERMFFWIESQIEENEYTEEQGNILKEILLKYGYDQNN